MTQVSQKCEKSDFYLARKKNRAGFGRSDHFTIMLCSSTVTRNHAALIFYYTEVACSYDSDEIFFQISNQKKNVGFMSKWQSKNEFIDVQARVLWSNAKANTNILAMTTKIFPLGFFRTKNPFLRNRAVGRRKKRKKCAKKTKKMRGSVYTTCRTSYNSRKKFG